MFMGICVGVLYPFAYISRWVPLSPDGLFFYEVILWITENSTSSIYDLIIIDDLGVENATQTAFTVIDTIYSNKIPMIVTTNLSPTELKGTTIIEKGRIYNRILEMCPCKLLVKNSGSRAKKGNDNLKDMMEILG